MTVTDVDVKFLVFKFKGGDGAEESKFKIGFIIVQF